MIELPNGNIYYSSDIVEMFHLTKKQVWLLASMLGVKKDSASFYIFSPKDVEKIKRLVVDKKG